MLLTMTLEAGLLAALGILWTLISGVSGWFLTGMHKDIRTVLINQERATNQIMNLAQDVSHVRSELSEHNSRISHIETSVARIEEWKKQV